MLFGNKDNDSLLGGAGNDTLSGGPGNDTIVFEAGSGVDNVHGFAIGDVLQIVGGVNGGSITSSTAAFDATTDSGGNAVVDLGSGNQIILIGVARTDLSTTSFEII